MLHLLPHALLALSLSGPLALQDAPPAPETEAAAPPLAERIAPLEETARAFVADGWAVGLVFGVLDGDERIVRGYGEVELGSGRTPDADTLWEIGSVSKVFTGVLLADAVARDVLDFEQTAQSVYGDEFTLAAHDDGPIRLRHLATHSSGLMRMPNNFEPASQADPYADYTLEQLYACLDDFEPRWPVDDRYVYSNLAMAFLGQLVAHAQDAAYEPLLEERIFAPLRMNDTTITLDAKQRARLAQGYDADGTPQPPWEMPTFAPAGGIRSTAADMLTFAEACVDPPEGAIGEALTLSMEPLGKAKRSRPMACAWHIGGGGATRWHNGQTGGYHTFFAVMPESDMAVFVVASTSSGLVDALGANAMRVVRGEDPEPLEYERAIDLDRETLAEYVGEYDLGWFSSIDVTLEGGALLARLTNQPAVRIYPSAKDRFFYRAVDARIVFERDESGKITGLVLHQNGQELKAERDEE